MPSTHSTGRRMEELSAWPPGQAQASSTGASTNILGTAHSMRTVGRTTGQDCKARLSPQPVWSRLLRSALPAHSYVLLRRIRGDSRNYTQHSYHDRAHCSTTARRLLGNLQQRWIISNNL